MSSTFGASIFAPSPTPACYQQHGSRLSLYSHQRVSVSKLSEATTAGSRSFCSVLNARVACAADTIELSDTSAEVHEPQSRLIPLINELTEGAPLASAVEPWLDKLSILDWKTLVRDVGDKDWAMAWQLVSHFKEKAPALSDSVSWPEEEKKAGTPTGEGEVTEEGDVFVDSSAAEVESTVQEGPSGAPKERSEIQGLYRALAKVLSKNKRTDEMDQLLQELKAEGVKPVPSLYYVMLAFYLSENLTEKCLNLVSEMKQDGIDILPATYEKIAFHFMNKEPIDLTVPTNIMRDLMNKGLPVSQSLLRNLLKAHWRNKDVEGVEEIFRAMQVAGHPPDQKAILKVIYCQKLVGNYERILELIELMTDMDITPNINVYDELISAYSKAGLMEKAKESLSQYDMKFSKKPTLVALNSLIHGYGKQGRSEEALQAFEDIQNNGYRPDAVSYSSVIAAVANAGQLTKALQLYRRMVRQNMQPKLHTYITLIHCLTKLDWTRKGRKIVNAMRKCPHPLTPEAVGAIFSLFVEGHWYHLAASVLMDIEKEGFPLNADASSGLIRSFGILGAKPTPLSKTVEKSNFEICKILTALFITQTDDGSWMASVFEKDLALYLEKFDHVDHARVVYNSFMDCLWKRGQKIMTSRLLKSARKLYAQSTVPEVLGSEWVLDVRVLSVGGAKSALSHWLRLVVEAQAVSSKADTKIDVWYYHEGLKQSRGDNETSEDSKRLEISKMVIVTGKENQLLVTQNHGILKRSITNMLADLKAPFVESPMNPEKLEAPAADFMKWAIGEKVKELLNVNNDS